MNDTCSTGWPRSTPKEEAVRQLHQTSKHQVFSLEEHSTFWTRRTALPASNKPDIISEKKSKSSKFSIHLYINLYSMKKMSTSELPWKILEQWRFMVIYRMTTYSNKLIFMQKMNFNPFLPPYIKLNPKWVIERNVKPKTIKLLDQNRRKIFVMLSQAKIS